MFSFFFAQWILLARYFSKESVISKSWIMYYIISIISNHHNYLFANILTRALLPSLELNSPPTAKIIIRWPSIRMVIWAGYNCRLQISCISNSNMDICILPYLFFRWRRSFLILPHTLILGKHKEENNIIIPRIPSHCQFHVEARGDDGIWPISPRSQSLSALQSGLTLSSKCSHRPYLKSA